MTAIIALSNGTNVWMAGDSFCGTENRKDLCKSPKVYKLGSLGIGLCGHTRQELILEKTLRKLIESDGVKVTHDWIKFTLPDILVEEMKKGHATIDKDEQATLGESSYLLAFGGKIYYLGEDFGIWESQRNIAAIGSGQEYALGALSALINSEVKTTSETKLKTALEITSEWSVWVSPPFQVIKV